MSSLIEISSLSKRFGTHWALKDVSFSIHPGESIALFGKNGSGKSTLLKILAKLLPVSSGKISYGSGSFRFLSHEKQLYEKLTVGENLDLVADLQGLGSLEKNSQKKSALQKLGIADRESQRVEELSEGLKKRVMLAKLLIGSTEPDLILLDEPHTNLDNVGREVLQSLIGGWLQQGKSLVTASHDHTETLSQAKRLIILEQGQVAYDGQPKSF